MAEAQRGAPDAPPIVPGAHFLIVEARFYEAIGAMLLAGAERALRAAGATFDRILVPGALEIPIAAAIALDAAEREGSAIDGVIALGCVLRGETFHFEIVALEFGARLDEPCSRAQRSGGEFDPDDEHDGAGRGSCRSRAWRQRRRSRAGGDFAGRAQAPAGAEMKLAAKKAAARLGAVQALYQMDVVGKGLPDVLAEFEAHWLGQTIEGETYNAADAELFREIVSGVLRDQFAIDPAVDAALAQGWPLKRIEALLRAVLRAGEWEILHRPKTPARVVIKEYVDVAAAFFDAEECGLVNGVLNTLARAARAAEFAVKD